MVAVDVGASYGVYTILFARRNGSEGQVFAFEPAVAAFHVLRRNLHDNGLRNVRLFRLALSDRRRVAHLHHAADPSRNSLGCPVASLSEGETVPVSTLDEIAKEETLPRLDVIKIDAEGAEELVLRGAARTVAIWRPVIIFEVNFSAAAALQLSQLGAYHLLKFWGYEVCSVDAVGDLRPVPEVVDGRNFVAVPA